MPGGDNAKGGPVDKPEKRVTRSSFRTSLNLASALAHVMNKDGKDGKEIKEGKAKATAERRKSASSPKDIQSRRSSVVGSGRNSSVLEPVVEGRQRHASVDIPSIKQARRSSAVISRAASGKASLDDTSSRTSSDTPTGSGTSGLTRTTTAILRPKSGVAGSSLPKYRPKSAAFDDPPKKQSSPVRAGTRRKHSSSEEDNTMPSNVTCAFVVHTPGQKMDRPISPIPKRSVKSGTSPPQKPTPTSTTHAPSRSQSSPMLRNKAKSIQKAPESPDNAKRILKPSPFGSGSSATPGTPRTPTLVKGAARYLNAITGRESPSPLRSSKISNTPSRKGSKTSLASGSMGKVAAAEALKGKSTASSAKSFVGDASTDSIDAKDVEFLLAASASPSAPTPAIPRMRNFFSSKMPETPSRMKRIASKSTLGLSLSPTEELPEFASPSSRSSSPRRMEVTRDSVAAWSKVADDSVQIDATELGGLILDMPAPFLPNTPGMLSPSPSIMRLESGSDDVTSSPSPSGVAPPNVFGSISQTLLPQFQSSPIFRLQEPEASEDNTFLEVPTQASANNVLIRKQLASMENLAKERLTRITQLEEQLHAMKEARAREVKELGDQLSELEEKFQDNLASRGVDRGEICHVACDAKLEQQLLQAEVVHRQSVDSAVERAKAEQAAKEQLKADQLRTITETACEASEKWLKVQQSASSALDSLRSDREMLATLLSSLSIHEFHLKSSLITTAY